MRNQRTLLRVASMPPSLPPERMRAVLSAVELTMENPESLAVGYQFRVDKGEHTGLYRVVEVNGTKGRAERVGD
jgi:hypothetical protein